MKSSEYNETKALRYFRGSMKLRPRLRALSVAMMVLGGIVGASFADVVVEPPGATVAGKTVGEWSTAWWQWAVALAPPGDPFTDFTGAFAGVNQSGPVFFLAGSPGGSRIRQFEVPTNTYVLIPLVVGEQSQLELGFDQTAAQIKQAAQQQADQIDSLHATLDGVTIPQATLLGHREASPDFNFVAVANNQLGVPAGASGIAVAVGYFLMLDPLPPGVHVLTYGGGASAFGISISETDRISVGAPKITMQPTNQTVLAGLPATFAVSATGSSPLSYQWYYNDHLVFTNGPNGFQPIGMAVSNANTSTLTFTAWPSSAGFYWVIVSNIASRVASSVAFLTVLTNPSTTVVVESQGATVAGRTIGEWSTNWWRWAAALAPPGDPFTDTTGQFANVNQSGPVFFLAGSPGGYNSRQFNVPADSYLLMPLLVGELSQLELGFDKTAAQIRQAAKDQADLIDSLHATFDGTSIPQATLYTHREVSPDFNFVAVANNQVGIFSAGNSGIAVADGYFLMLGPLTPGTHVLNYGAGLSSYGIFIDETDTITVTVPVAPAIITQPVSLTVDVGQSASFTVTATGSPLNYQWRKDGVDLAGATSATCNLGPVDPSQAGSYTVVVSNLLGSVTSAPPAVLTVNVVAAAPGTVVAWGEGTSNTGWPYSGQSIVPATAQGGVTFIAAGGFHTLALKQDGSVLAWGNNDYGQTAVPAGLSGVKMMSAGWYHTVALKNDGSVVAWGAGTTTADDPHYGQSFVPLAAQSGVAAIAAGTWHTVALKTNGSVVAWGDNRDGQTTVPVAAQSGITAIAAGALHTVALTANGAVLAWGGNASGQTVVPAAAQSGVTAIASGTHHTVALKNDGSVLAWGYNYFGQTDVPLAAQTGVAAISAKGYHTVALKTNGLVLAWGYNEYGQTNVPAGLAGVTAIAAGGFHTVALLGTGVVVPVSLTSRSSGNELILSWSTNAVGFTLQSATNLAPPLTWIDSTNPTGVTGTQFTVTNTISGPAQFYRLRKP